MSNPKTTAHGARKSRAPSKRKIPCDGGVQGSHSRCDCITTVPVVYCTRAVLISIDDNVGFWQRTFAEGLDGVQFFIDELPAPTAQREKLFESLYGALWTFWRNARLSLSDKSLLRAEGKLFARRPDRAHDIPV